MAGGLWSVSSKLEQAGGDQTSLPPILWISGHSFCGPSQRPPPCCWNAPAEAAGSSDNANRHMRAPCPTDSNHPPSVTILALQRSIGNVMSRSILNSTKVTASPAGFSPPPGPLRPAPPRSAPLSSAQREIVSSGTPARRSCQPCPGSSAVEFGINLWPGAECQVYASGVMI